MRKLKVFLFAFTVLFSVDSFPQKSGNGIMRPYTSHPTYMDSLLNRAKEIPGTRTLFSGRYKTADGKVISQFSSQPVSFRNDFGTLEAIDVRLRPSPSGRSWLADKQLHPCALNEDLSTSITLDGKGQLIFNKDVKVNGVVCKQTLSSIDQTVATIRISEDITKKITFRNGSVETDYILLHKPERGGFTASEEIEYPGDCRLVQDSKRGKPAGEKWFGDFILLSANGKEQARFHAPVCYDANGKYCSGAYVLNTANSRSSLSIIVGQSWLEKATYPVTVDPTITGPVSNWTGGSMPSCLLPNYTADSILVTIPPGITITGFYITTSYVTLNLYPVKDGRVSLKTKCFTEPAAFCDSSIIASVSTCGLYGNLQELACCYPPSCSPDSFYLVQHLSRDSAGTGCDTNYVYYDPTTLYPLSGYIIGLTDTCVWRVNTTTLCSNSCELALKAVCRNGVPPYTVSHPWSSTKVTGGTASGGCSTEGVLTLNLTIPHCPVFCGKADTIAVPPPLVVDACGDTVQGLTSRNIFINPSPQMTASPDTLTVCNGLPMDFSLSACLPGTSFTWTGSDKTSGSGVSINDTTKITSLTPLKVIYKVASVYEGCPGDTLIVQGQIDPCPIISVPNVITPNGDGINDDFVIKNLNYFPNSKVTIYDRWGLNIYHSDNYLNNWNASGFPDGTYYYVLYVSDGRKGMAGFLSILR